MNSQTQTELGVFPSDWQVQRFDSLLSVQQGKQVSKRNRVGEDQRPFLRTKNVFWGRLDLTDLDEMHFTAAEQKRLALRLGDLLICEGGDIGRTAIWQNEIANCYYQNHLHRARLREGARADVSFVLFWLWYAFNVGNVYFGRGNVTTIPNLSQSKLCELPLPVPPLDEQRKIGAVLESVQRAIERQDQLLTLTAELKKALLNHLFTHGLRDEPQKQTEVGPIPRSWDLVYFSDFVGITNGQVDPRESPYREMLHVGPENIEAKTGHLMSLYTNGELGVRSGNYLFSSENVLYSKIRPYLRKVALPDFSGTCSADMYPLRPKDNRLIRGFLFHLLLSEQFSKQAVSFQDRTGIPKINRRQLGRIQIPIPTLEEQREIAKALDAVNSKLGIHRQKQLTLTALFRSLIHELMTARIRVNDLDL